MQHLYRDEVDVGRHLEDAVRRGVDDRLARGQVLRPEGLDDAGAGSRDVAEGPSPDRPLESGDDLRRETVRVGRERARQDHASKLPVTRDGILARRGLDHRPEGTPGVVDGWRAPEGDDVADAEAAQIGEIETADGARRIADAMSQAGRSPLPSPAPN